MNLSILPRSSLACLLACLTLTAGDLTDRFQLTLDRVKTGGPPRYTEALVLADVIPQATRRFTNYSGDVSGRYIGALATASPFADADGPPLARIVSGILSLQKPDGYFGRAFTLNIGHDEMALLWGNGRLLIGMLEYYKRHPTPDLLNSARRTQRSASNGRRGRPAGSPSPSRVSEPPICPRVIRCFLRPWSCGRSPNRPARRARPGTSCSSWTGRSDAALAWPIASRVHLVRAPGW